MPRTWTWSAGRYLVRRALSRYSWAVLFKCDVAVLSARYAYRAKDLLAAYAPGSAERQAPTPDEKRRVLSFHRQSGEIVYALERQAYKDGYHLAMGLGGGSCKDYLCQGMICQFLDSGRCRFPHRARPAMEALGIDVIDLIAKSDRTLPVRRSGPLGQAGQPGPVAAHAAPAPARDPGRAAQAEPHPGRHSSPNQGKRPDAAP